MLSLELLCFVIYLFFLMEYKKPYNIFNLYSLLIHTLRYYITFINLVYSSSKICSLKHTHVEATYGYLLYTVKYGYLSRVKVPKGWVILPLWGFHLRILNSQCPDLICLSLRQQVCKMYQTKALICHQCCDMW